MLLVSSATWYGFDYVDDNQSVVVSLDTCLALLKQLLSESCQFSLSNGICVSSAVYTVIKTKAPVTVAEYKSRYCLIGPLSYKSAPMEVEATEPSTPEMKATLKSMSDKGVKYLYGRWLIEGGPNVLLFDTGSMMGRLDEWKSDLWNLAGIPTPPSDSETNETVVFGYLVAWFLGEVSFKLEIMKRMK